MSARPLLRSLLPLLLVLTSIVVSASRVHAQCLPAVCNGTPVLVNFESLPAGTTVEGLGAVDPDLDITSLTWTFGPSCTPGSATIIEAGNPSPTAYGTGSTPNGCLTGLRGFGDASGCVLDYDFTFASGVTVSCFSIRMLDYGDLLPFGGTSHVVTVTAYDASNTQVGQDVLTMTGGVDLVAGDACTAGPNDPGNHLFTVTGAGITKVTLRFDASPDPNVGFDDVSFCEEANPTPTRTPSWGGLKISYR